MTVVGSLDPPREVYAALVDAYGMARADEIVRKLGEAGIPRDRLFDAYATCFGQVCAVECAASDPRLALELARRMGLA